jgi:hypothetical protein
MDGVSAHRKACIYIGKQRNGRTRAYSYALSGFRMHDLSARVVDEITCPLRDSSGRLKQCIAYNCYLRVTAHPQVACGDMQRQMRVYGIKSHGETARWVGSRGWELDRDLAQN